MTLGFGGIATRVLRLGLGLLALALANGEATAVDFRVHAQTTAQAYQQRTAARDILNRRRIQQALGLDVSDILGDGQNRLFVASQLRWDSDFGVGEADERAIAGLQNHRLQILHAYVVAREWLPYTEIGAGRRWRIDPEGLLLYDGVDVTVRTPYYFGVEAIAGIEAKNALGPVTDTAFELDGTEGDERTTVVWGFAGFLTGLRNSTLRLAYRRFDSAGSVDREVVALSGSQRLFERLRLAGDFVFDFCNARTEFGTAGVGVSPHRDLDIQLDWRYQHPSFRADSIFNVFDVRPQHDVSLDVAGQLLPTLWLHGALLVQVGDDDGPRNFAGGREGLGFRAGVRWDFSPRGAVQAEFARESGSGGDRTLLDVSSDYDVPGDWLGVEGRFTFIDFSDPLQERQHGQSYGFEAGLRLRVRDVAVFHGLVEQNFNRFLEASTRVMLVADLGAGF